MIDQGSRKVGGVCHVAGDNLQISLCPVLGNRDNGTAVGRHGVLHDPFRHQCDSDVVPAELQDRREIVRMDPHLEWFAKLRRGLGQKLKVAARSLHADEIVIERFCKRNLAAVGKGVVRGGRENEPIMGIGKN